MHELDVKCDFPLVTLDDLLVWKSRGKLPVMLSFFLMLLDYIKYFAR